MPPFRCCHIKVAWVKPSVSFKGEHGAKGSVHFSRGIKKCADCMLCNADSFNLNYTFRLKGMLSWEEKKKCLVDTEDL